MCATFGKKFSILFKVLYNDKNCFTGRRNPVKMNLKITRILHNSSISTFKYHTLPHTRCLDGGGSRGPVVGVLHAAGAGGVVGVALTGNGTGVGGEQVQQLQEGQDDHERFQSFLQPHTMYRPDVSVW